MKKAKQNKELRAEYRREDFPKGFVRGKFAERLKLSQVVGIPCKSTQKSSSVSS